MKFDDIPESNGQEEKKSLFMPILIVVIVLVVILIAYSVSTNTGNSDLV